MPELRIVPLNLHDEATLSTGAAPSLPATNTQNQIRTRVMRTADATTFTLLGTLAATCSATLLGLFRHTAHGGTIQLDLYSDAAWSSSVYSSGALPATSFPYGSGFDWGLLDDDPLVANSPFVLWFDEQQFQSYKITFSGTPSADTAWQVSRVFLGKHFEAGINQDFGSTIGFGNLTDRERSRGGSLYANRSELWKTQQLDMGMIDEADRAVWLDIMERCGTNRDFVISWFPEDGTRLERDHTVCGTFSNLNAIGRQVSYLTGRFQVEEN